MGKILFDLQNKTYYTLDRVCAIIFLSLAMTVILSMLYLNRYGIYLPLILLISSLLYLRFRNIMSSEWLSTHPESSELRLASHIIFIISLSLMVWLSWSNLYYRPPLYFILLLLAIASIILDIFYLDKTKNIHINISLLKTIVLSIAVYAGIYYEFPGIYGVDPWLHNRWAQETINLGYITLGDICDNGYYLFPIFNLVGAISTIMTDLVTYNSIFATVGILMAISTIFVFILGRIFVGTRAALLIAIIIPLTANNIERATSLIPMSLGYLFFLFILYLIFSHVGERILIRLIIIILSVSLIMTHTIASLVALLSLIVIFFIGKAYKKIDCGTQYNDMISFTFIIIFGVTMLNKWMQNPPSNAAFFDWNIRKLSESLQMDAQFTLSSVPIVNEISTLVLLFNSSGYFILLTFGIIGSLIYLHPKNRNLKRVVLVFLTGMFFAIPYSFSLFKLNNILPDRWFIFFYIPLSVLAISGLVNIASTIKNNIGKNVTVMLVILVIIFTMTTSGNANDDSPFFFNDVVRLGYTQSELTGIKTLSEMGGGLPVTDHFYGRIFPYVIDPKAYSDMVEGDNTIFVQRNYYLHHPEWDEKYKTRIYKGGADNFKPEFTTILNYMKENGINNESLIYNNGNLKTYTFNKNQNKSR